ncbi:MAG: cation-efflux pump [Anaerolineae bacterium]|nr:cation-efflux pump [Anaerolineae bacterium]
MTTPQPNTRQEVRRVLYITLALNVLVAVSKVVIGLVTGVLAITADGFHSMVDGSSNVVALVANRLADRPPDDDHPYGHRRFETIAALGIGAFLLFTAWEIITSAFDRLGGGGAQPEITPLSFVVMIGTLLVNIFVTTYEARAGKRLHSELLTADAAHTRSDVFVTISVLVSMVLVVVFGWLWADTVAALVIVVLIVRAAWEVLSRAGGVLVDTAPYTPEQLTTWAEELPSVEQVVRARSRGPADAAFIDIDVQVAPEMTADHTAAIADAIRQKLGQHIEGLAEVEVHFVPAENGDKDYSLLARARADALGLGTHEVRVSDGERGKLIEMHVEVPPGQTLGAAHERVTRLEQEVQAALPDVAEVVTHIEPALTALPTIPETPDETAQRLKRLALDLLMGHYPHAEWHQLRVYPGQNGFTLTLHVTLPAQITVDAAHRIAESAETLLRAEMPQIERVTIHTEPPENNG